MNISFKDHFFNFLFKRLQHFIPVITFSIMVFFFVSFIKTHKTCYFLASFITPYLFPLSLFRFVHFFYPIKEGGSYIGLDEKKFSPWLFSLRAQQIYLVFPIFERFLLFLPGLFALWLRLWGAKVGKMVFFTPGIVINDRSLIEIGDYVVFGHNNYLSSHLLRVKNNKFFVYVRKIRIENGSFIGAFSKLGPGTTIKANSIVDATSEFSVNQKFPGKQS